MRLSHTHTHLHYIQLSLDAKNADSKLSKWRGLSQKRTQLESNGMIKIKI